MAAEDGPELILRNLITGLKGMRRGAGYQHSPQVYRGRVHLESFSGSENEELYVETAEELDESRNNLTASLAECTCGIEIWCAIQDHARGPSGAERDTSEKLSAFIRDVLKRIYARDWDMPSWNAGRGHVDGVNFPQIQRFISPGVSLKIARIVCEVKYQDSNDFE